VFIALFVSLVTTAHAQTPAATAQAADPQAATPPPADDDDARLDLAEPDFSVVNLPTTLRLPKYASNFHLTHRFTGINWWQDSFSDIAGNLFGLDAGANIGLEYRFGVMRHLEAVVQRTTVSKTFQFSAKYDGWHQSATLPVSISGIVSIEGDNNFRENYAPALGVVVSRTVNTRLALYATPVWVHNSAGGTGEDRDTGFFGLGARARVLSSTYLTFEVSPRIGGYAINDAEYGFGIEKRVGAHVFQLTFTNGAATTYRQLSHGGNPQSLYLGFNLTRKFF
jgi:hypothetical protein